MDIKYEIEPIFKINFFKLSCLNFKNKRQEIEKFLEHYPEMPFPNFLSNRNKANFVPKLLDVFSDEFNFIRAKFNCKIVLDSAWSVSYRKGDYHVPHNHSSKGYTGIIYLRMSKDSPKTTFIQPWNNELDQSVLYTPPVETGDILITPQFVTHYTEPNKINFKKRIISFDFHLEPILY
tara:strand:- start:315 stop:848 length:534 start_codon:yes stop_codon:yes gene_type:complete